VNKVPSNLERLKAERVFDADEITEDEKNLVEGMSKAEVDKLIDLRKKQGPTAKGREKIRPNFPL
jgi:hypothetical protein